jgi:hypothetical protein
LGGASGLTARALNAPDIFNGQFTIRNQKLPVLFVCFSDTHNNEYKNSETYITRA